jgi:DNA-binding LacI/PurR family transcriptional regulator
VKVVSLILMQTNRTKHSEVARELRAEIASGKYGAEGRLPSEAQLVKRFGVSRPTIGQALRALESEGLVARRAGSGTYARPAGGVSAGRLLALLIPDLGNTEIFQLICGEIASLARVHDFSLVWGGSGQPRLDAGAGLQHARELCRHYIERRVSGVFFAPYELLPEQEAANRDMAVMLRDAGIQVVLLDRDLAMFPRRHDFDVVGVDNVAAGWQLAEHLIKLGCRRLQFISRPLSAPTVQARVAGAREALAQHRIACAEDWVREGDPGDVKFVRHLLVPNRPDAFLCANDHTAALLMRSLAQLKVSVPRDVRVVGMDDVKFATLVSPALTTMQQPCREIAITAFRAMTERLADPTLPARQITLAPRLIVRDSCGAYLPRKSR